MVMRSLNITLHINILEFKCKNKYKLKILISLKMKFKRRFIASTNNWPSSRFKILQNKLNYLINKDLKNTRKKIYILSKKINRMKQKK